MKILLINPPLNRLKGLKVVNFPLGLGYLAGSLRDAGHDVRIWNAEMPKEELPDYDGVRYEEAHHQHQLYVDALKDDSNPAWLEATTLFEEHQPDLVGITAVSPKLPSALKLARIAKKANPACKVIFGGAHATVCPNEVLGYDEVDFAIRGEGERTVVELSSAIAANSDDFSGIAGLSYKKDGKVVSTQQRSLIGDLDQLPLPARDLMIDAELYDPQLMGSIVTSRGCPYKCTYCAAKNIWTRKVRYRSANSVVDEIEGVVNQFGTTHFDLWDDSFTVSKKHATAVCEEIIRRGLKIDWWCMTRADLMDIDLLRLMRSAGCTDIAIGVETGSPRMMKLIEKEVSLDDCFKAIKMMHRSGIRTTAFMMIGFPQETEDDMRKTIELCRNLHVSSIRIAVFTPYPGSPLYLTADEMGLLPEAVDWSHFSRHSPDNHFVKDVSREIFRKYVDEVIQVVDHENHCLANRVRNWRAQLPYLLKHPGELVGKIAGKLRG